MAQKYDLEVLLGLRRQQKDDAEDNYGAQVAELERRRRQVVEQEHKLKQAIDDRHEHCAVFDARILGAAFCLHEQRRFDEFVSGLKLEEETVSASIDEARDAESQQARTVESARQALVEATKELKAVEKHHEKWLAQQKLIRQRKQAAELDDIAARSWRENNS